MKTVAIINESTVCSDVEVQGYVPDLQTQVSRDFVPHWGVDAQLIFLSKGQVIPADAWVLHVLDDSDQAGALGYHDLNDGVPRGFVFARSDKQNGNSVSVTISHELLELLADPFIFSTVLYQQRQGFRSSGYLLAQEVADACEADQFGYLINKTLVSDFVTPAWFGAPLPAGGKYSFMGHCTQPFQILQGGYIGALSLRGIGQWTQVTGRAEESHWVTSQMVDGKLQVIQPPVGSRRERRHRFHRKHRLFGENVAASRLASNVTALGAVRDELGNLLGDAENSLHKVDNATNWIASILAGLASGKKKVRVGLETNPVGFGVTLEDK